LHKISSMPGSNAISVSNVAAATAFMLEKGNFNPNSPFLPQSISIFAEANTANQSGLSNLPLQITSAKQAADAYGYGSPMHLIARVLFPPSGGGVSIPVYCFAQDAAVASVAKVITITPSGNATANGTVYVKVSGRNVLDGGSYAVNIASGDTPTVQCDKFRAAIASVLGCPVTGSGTATFIATAKWTGLTSNDINIEIDTTTANASVGATYGVVNTTAGSGTPTVTASLDMFGNDWNTLVINSYGLVSATMAEFEAFNGIPDDVNPTGRYQGLAWKPLIALSGTLLDDPSTITDAGVRPDNVTIATCPAPLSLGLGFEAAANYAAAIWNVFQNKPNTSVLNLALPDMPAPTTGNVPAMVSYTVRDAYVKKGCSTIDFVNGRYIIKDFVTTYHADGDVPPHYRYPRDLNAYFNLKYRLAQRELEALQGKQLANDDDVVTASDVVTPASWKTEIFDIIDDSVKDGLIVDAAFSKASVQTGISGQNPNRMDTLFNVKISGVAYQSAVTVKGGFNFGAQ
jgi:phage tail sheath gpL-like